MAITEQFLKEKGEQLMSELLKEASEPGNNIPFIKNIDGIDFTVETPYCPNGCHLGVLVVERYGKKEVIIRCMRPDGTNCG